MKFTDFELGDPVLWGIEDMGFSEATPIQAQAIPIILKGKDLIGCAQTGTGKTAAFLIPTLDYLNTFEQKAIRCLIICPTRELAKQIDEQIEGLSYHTVVTSISVYGGGKGSDFSEQKAAITGGCDIVVATPGRLIQHLTLGYMNLDEIEVVILDEADRMLDMGFHEDIMRILSYVREERQTLLFSATMPPKIRSLAKEIMKNPEEISLALSKPAAGINQQAYLVHDGQKLDLLKHIFEKEEIESMIMFASRKSSVDQIVRQLQKLGHDVYGIHSDREQEERERILNDFRNKQFKVLVATDVMSRGIDIDGISHVLNYDVPADAEDYVHRIGRTARAEATGTGITLINGDDVGKFMRIERLIESEVPKIPLPEGFSEGPEYRSYRGRGGGNRGGGKGRGGKGRGGKKFRSGGRKSGGGGGGKSPNYKGKDQSSGGSGKSNSGGNRNKKRRGSRGKGGGNQGNKGNSGE